MAAMVEGWMSELTKLKVKVEERARNPTMLSKARERGEGKQETAAKQSRKEMSKVVQKDPTLSEDSVVFLLMDRFTPL